MLLVVSTLTNAGLAVYAIRNRQEPGAIPFGLLMCSLVVWSGTYAVGLLTADPYWRMLVLRIMWLGLTTLYVWLFLFALSYTGNGDLLTRRSLALVFVIPAVITIAVWTNPWHHLFWIDQSVVIVDGLAVMDPVFGPLFWVQVVFSYALIAISASLLLRLIYQSDYLYADQSVLLLVGIAAPLAMNMIDIVGVLPQPGVDYTPHAFTVTGLAFGYALFRRQLFDLVPATRQLGRHAAIRQLDDGVVIVDTEHRIVYCNASAGDVIGADPADLLGVNVRAVVDDSRIDFGPADALAEIDRDDRTYEVRTSPITDRRDRLIGHTLVVHDVTARIDRERRLAAQRDELETVSDLNTVLRGVNRGLVSATSRDEIERTVCEEVADADLYRTACIGDVATWTGDADRWFVAGDHEVDSAPLAIDGDEFEDDDDGRVDVSSEPIVRADHVDEVDGTWIVVPLAYGRTVYGALGLHTNRPSVSDRERSVLAELGETVGHAINAVESRLLLTADAVIELELQCTDEADPFVATASELSCTLEIVGIVPGQGSGIVAYVGVDGADTADVADALGTTETGRVRTIKEGSDGLLEWTVTGGALLQSLYAHGAHVDAARADGDTATYELAVASESDVRVMLDHVSQEFPSTRVLSKRERSGPVDRPEAIGGNILQDLTDRQREAVEAAYRAGYFNWPRDSNAEEVAETLDISSATLHGHLRKAQHSILTDIFSDESSNR
ncbi:histidine kinase N-terminal 7TM domain-containing protein [Halovivax cerinus]|uniref:Histidine kinase N-terminal 7TM domain-containing protein n=1 Tax=Halovivax cerinus TaxID=1487865 RepID=A0ABD5NJX1_9EURY